MNNYLPNVIDLLGMNRAIRRSYEIATSRNPEIIEKWHQLEIKAALKRYVKRK